jgi:Tfp pilus assembly protein PilO
MKIDLKKNLTGYKKTLTQAKTVSQQPLFKASTNLALSLLLIILLSLLAIKPTLVTITKLLKEIEQAKQINQQMKRKIVALEQLRSTYPEIERNIQLVDNSLPKQVEFPNFAKRINYFVTSNNVQLVSHNFGQFDLLSSAIQEDKGSADFQITFAGSFVGIKQFIQDLENMDRIVKINSLSISSKTDVQGTELKAAIEGQTFWLPESAIKQN